VVHLKAFKNVFRNNNPMMMEKPGISIILESTCPSEFYHLKQSCSWKAGLDLNDVYLVIDR
jgi:hypothetical protein